MKPRLQATRAVRELIKAYEPFHADAVRRGRRWVIGWGHRATAKEGASIKPDDAELLLIYDAIRAQDAVDGVAGEDIPKASRDALASFAASIGLSAFKVSDVARHAKAGRLRDAGAALDSWVRAEEDGRLVVSDRLVERRRAEKTLLLEGLDEPVADAASEGVEAELETEREAVLDDEPRLGPLVDVDIAFEDEPQQMSAPVEEPEPEPDADPEPELDPEPEVEAELDAETVDEAVDEAVEEVDVAEAESDPAALEVENAQHVVDEADAEQDRKSQQDAAIAAVMSRMASDIAESVSRPEPSDAPAFEPEDEPEDGASEEADLEAAEADVEAEPPAPVKLGYSYLTPAKVALDPEADQEATPVSDDLGAPQAEPIMQVEPVSEPAPTPVYASVSVSTPPNTESVAPPHPALAPASAPGLSGESEGPDHPEEDEAETSQDEDALDPAIVAGPEASELTAPGSDERSGGGLVYPALLGIGVVLTGLGVWELASHWDAYSSLGLEFSPLGPVVFGAGVLLAVGAGWFVFRKR